MYVLDTPKAVSEMARILTPDGCVVAGVRGSMDALSHDAVRLRAASMSRATSSTMRITGNRRRTLSRSRARTSRPLSLGGYGIRGKVLLDGLHPDLGRPALNSTHEGFRFAHSHRY